MIPLSQPSQRRRLWRFRIVATIVLIGLCVYGALAYGLVPYLWRHYEHQKSLSGLPMITTTALGIPGDALNVGLEGSQDDVVCAMHAAGWSPADPVTLKSSLKIIGSVLFDRPYHEAPVSPLFYQGRREDLAFQKPAGRSADTRHHVRFWKAVEAGDDGLPVWLGAVTFDRGIGLNHYTWQITHHIAPDIDAERDLLSADLAEAGKVDDIYEASGVDPSFNLRNGGGDPYYTDGEILLSKLAPGCDSHVAAPTTLPNPPVIDAKNWLWRRLAPLTTWLRRSPVAAADKPS
jgi:LssY C-terminus